MAKKKEEVWPPKKSNELKEAELQIFQMTNTIECLFYITVNAHADLKREWGNGTIIGEPILYELLKRFGKCGLSEDQKQDIFEEVDFIYSEESKEAKLLICKTFAYDRFLRQLVEFNKMINEKGMIVDYDPD